MKLVLFLSTLTLSGNLMAKEFTCPEDLGECLAVISSETGKTYIFNQKIKGKVQQEPQLVFDEKNGERLISLILYRNGYARIPVESKTYQVINARETRYHALPLYSGASSNLPDTYDYISFEKKLKNPELSREAVRAMRPLVSRYGRIIEYPQVGVLLIMDQAKNTKRLVEIVDRLDKKLSPSQIKEIKEIETLKKKIRDLKLKLEDKTSFLPLNLKRFARIYKKMIA